ncbi:MAG: hypothetical protein PGN08_00450 [Sphingomonas taxi]
MATALLPGGGWSESTALLALVAGIEAVRQRRTLAVAVAAGLAVGIAPAGLLLAPLFAGWTIRQGRARHLPIMVLSAAIIMWLSPWAMPAVTLPNLALLPTHAPESLALVAALGCGVAAWLLARASVQPPGAVLHEARLGTLALAAILPLSPGALLFVLAIAALPLPPRPRAANDNAACRRSRRYEPAQDRLALLPGGG